MAKTDDDKVWLGFLLHMKNKAKEARSRRRRISYGDEDKVRSLEFLEVVERAGGTFEDAAELLSMHRATLAGWLDRATGSEGEWAPDGSLGSGVVVNVNVDVHQ
tara:strand:- start:148 stop:459 length:312 start_codon:yes stop_codon:yes gene_type:complete